MRATYCYSHDAATGLSQRMVGPRYVAAPGEFLSSPEPASDAALAARFPGYAGGVKTRLLAYARRKHLAIATGGLKVNIGTSAAPIYIEVGTDALSLSWLHLCAAQAAGDPKAGFTSPGAGGETLTGAQVMTIFSAVAAFVQSCLAVLRAVVAAIDAGTITTTAQVDAPPAPLPPWPVNS